MAGSVFFVGARREAVAIVQAVVDSLTGANGENADLAVAVKNAVGFEALADVTDDFLVKSRGGTGVDGVKWAPLAPATLAYGRRAPRGRGFAPGGKDGLLTAAQLQRWRDIYGSRLERLALSLPPGDASSFAAAIAWTEIKKEGGKTKIGEYANRPHEIGRDTGVLLNSLSPGELSATTYTNPTTEGGSDQVFQPLENGVVVGTNVAYASAFAKKRPIVPSRIPQSWLDGWVRVANRALAAALQIALARETA